MDKPISIDEELFSPPIIALDANSFLILSEDEETYNFVRFPIQEGIISGLSGLLSKAGDFSRWLLGDLKSLLAKVGFGNGNQGILKTWAKLAKQNPALAKSEIRKALVKQGLSGDKLDSTMKNIDSKMSRFIAARSSLSKAANEVQKAKQEGRKPDPSSLRVLQAHRDTVANIHAAEEEARNTGADPVMAGRQAAKSNMLEMTKKGLGHIINKLNGTESGHEGNSFGYNPPVEKNPPQQDKAGKVGPGAKGGEGKDQQTATQPANTNNGDNQKELQLGDKVWMKDKGGNILQGTVEKAPEMLGGDKVLLVKTGDGQFHSPNAGWSKGNPPQGGQQQQDQPEQPQAQPEQQQQAQPEQQQSIDFTKQDPAEQKAIPANGNVTVTASEIGNDGSVGQPKELPTTNTVGDFTSKIQGSQNGIVKTKDGRKLKVHKVTTNNNGKQQTINYGGGQK